jgi:hypothetical protein
MARQVFSREDFDGLAEKLWNLRPEQQQRELLVAVFSAAGDDLVVEVEAEGENVEETLQQLLDRIRNAFTEGDGGEHVVMFRIGHPITPPPS